MNGRPANDGLIVLAVCGLAFMFGAPHVLQLFAIINLTTAIGLALLGLSLGLVWGYGGILCFGQTAFFGLGAYAYAIAAQNSGETTGAIVVALAVGGASAAILGYFMFYGRISDVYLGVITLTVTLIFFNLLRRTSGPEYKIGKALLGGFNGTAAPPLQVPWSGVMLSPQQQFSVAMGVLLLGYFGCIALTRSYFGRVCVSIRENEVRAELLGYDARLYKLGLFSIGGSLAAVGGILVATGIGRVTPDLFNLTYAAQAIIWVIVGGRGTLLGPVLGSFGVFWLTSWLGTQSYFNSNMVLGLVLILFVLLLPRGVVPAVAELAGWRRRRGVGHRGRIRARRRAGRRVLRPAE